MIRNVLVMVFANLSDPSNVMIPAGCFREVYRIPEQGVLHIESTTTINGQTASTLQVCILRRPASSGNACRQA